MSKLRERSACCHVPIYATPDTSLASASASGETSPPPLAIAVSIMVRTMDGEACPERCIDNVDERLSHARAYVGLLTHHVI